jgi:hypothetical protein
MDWYYDGQIRRYVTQFMRIFIGFKWRAGDGTEKTVPVTYGDISRQVATLIRENSENKLPSVPKISCYITGLELDTSRISDPSFVSKVNIRQRAYDIDQETGDVDYKNYQGGYYTVERLLPTPYKMTMKADIWTSGTDQKLQFFEQISVLFHPSLEIQTTDNYLDWTSLTVVELKQIGFTSRSIPVGVESDIDVMSMEFEIPIYISPPAKVKKLGIVKSIIANVFTENGDLVDLENLAFNQETGDVRWTSEKFRILLFKSNNGEPNDYDVTIVDPSSAIKILGIPEKDVKIGGKLTWNQILEQQGGYTATSRIFFTQANGFEITGTFAVNPINPEIMVVRLDPDTIPQNSLINSSVPSLPAKGTVDAIIDPYKFNPLTRTDGRVLGVRYLVLDDVNPSGKNQDGPDAWKNLDGSDPEIKANSIIEWDGESWRELFDPLEDHQDPIIIQNMRTLIKYRWVDGQWLKAFEGEYAPGYWRFDLDA